MTHIKKIEESFIATYGFVPTLKDLFTFVDELDSLIKEPKEPHWCC
jgi:hypothetical protein